MQETQVRSLGQEDLLEKETATHSSILAWKIPRTEEPGGLQFMGSQRGDTTERLSLSLDFFGGSDGKQSACNAWQRVNGISRSLDLSGIYKKTVSV